MTWSVINKNNKIIKSVQIEVMQIGCEGLSLHRHPPFFLRSQQEGSRGAIVGARESIFILGQGPNSRMLSPSRGIYADGEEIKFDQNHPSGKNEEESLLGWVRPRTEGIVYQ